MVSPHGDAALRFFRSSGIVPPESFTEAQVRDGFGEFDEMCVGCHGAPGKKRNEIGKGLRPQAPDLAESARSWTSGNLFWIVKNGVKMTAMPAFGPTHDDATIWNIVAFLNRLPSTTPDQYARLKEENAGPEGNTSINLCDKRSATRRLTALQTAHQASSDFGSASWDPVTVPATLSSLARSVDPVARSIPLQPPLTIATLSLV